MREIVYNDKNTNRLKLPRVYLHYQGSLFWLILQIYKLYDLHNNKV